MKKFFINFLFVLIALLSGCRIEPDNGQNEEKGTLTILDYPGRSFRLEAAIGIFKSKYPDIEVQVLDNHGDSESWDSYAAKISTEIMSGKGPDIIMNPNVTLSLNMNPYKLMRSGAFYSLNEFIRNETYAENDILCNPILQAGTYKGNLYIMPLGYTIPCILTSEESLNRAGISAESCTTYLGFSEEIDRYLHDESLPLWLNESEDFTPYFPSCLGIDYVNYDLERVDFSFEKWPDIMEYYKRYNQFYSFERGISRFTSGKDIVNERCVFTMAGTNSGENLFYHTGIINSKMQAHWIPIPTVHGGSGAYIFDSMAITSTSSNRLLAEAFLRIMLSEEVQSSYSIYHFPIRMDCLFYRYQGGNRRLEQEGYPPLSMEWYAQFVDMVEHIETAYLSLNDTLTFHKYMKPYLADEKSYSYCIDELENYYSIFLSE